MSILKNICANYHKKIARNYRLISFPKSGRTWVRLFLNYYYFNKYPFSVTERTSIEYYRSIPLVRYAHYGYTAKNTTALRKEIEKTIRSKLYKYEILFLIRDPRDVFVSYYYQLTKRVDNAKKLDPSINWDTIKMEELVYHDLYGIKRIIEFMNFWFAELKKFKKSFYVIQYENLKQSPHNEFQKLLEYIDKNPINQQALDKAIKDTSFKKMKEAEEKQLHEVKQLNGSSEDPNTMKVRKGEVGDFVNHFNQKELTYMKNAMNELNPELKRHFPE